MSNENFQHILITREVGYFPVWFVYTDVMLHYFHIKLEDWLSQKGPCQRFQTPRSKIRGLRSWYQMKGLARRNTHVKYESSSNNQSKVMSKVKGFEKKVKLKRPRVKVMVWNERSCYKEYTYKIWKPWHLPIKSYEQG
jgi:hypothetical protein